MKVVVAKNSSTNVYHMNWDCEYAPSSRYKLYDRALADAWNYRPCKHCRGVEDVHRSHEVSLPVKIRRGLVEVDDAE